MLFLLGYVLTTQIGLILRLDFGSLTPLWPASGIGLALLWQLGRGWWPIILAGELITAWWLGQPLTMGLLGGMAQVIEALLALFIARRAGIRELFRDVPETVHFVFVVCMIPPLVSASIGSAAQLFYGLLPMVDWRSGWFTWWLGDAMGLLLIAPVILTWWHWPFEDRRAMREWAGLAALFILTGVIVILFVGPIGDHLFFLLLLFVVWMALRFGAAGATSATFILAALVFGLKNPDRDDAALIAVYVLFVGLSACTSYVLAAAMAGRRRLFQELRHRASHDSLTGLINRPRFDVELGRMVQGRDKGAEHALIYLDLDHFKLVNDTCGHQAGDDLLHDLADKLATEVPRGVVLARLGGDEFAILLTDIVLSEVEALAQRLRRTVLDYRFIRGEYAFTLGVSIGITTFRRGEPAAAVLSRADIACYTAKDAGRDQMHVYRSTDLGMQQHRSELEWVSHFQRSLRDGEFVLYAQRIEPVADGASSVPFFEVLLRKQDKSGLTSPGAFLPVAARYGLMPAIDQWVVAESFKMIAAHPGANFRLSINLAAATIDRPLFLDRLESLTSEYDIDPARVCFEVTETIAIRQMSRAAEIISHLSERGFQFALDDFGAGVASYGYMNQLPLHYVKVDGQFVLDLADNPASRIIVSSLRDVAALRGIRCIAEWVESEAVMSELRRIGIDYAQGFHIHKPEPLAQAVGVGP